MCSSYYLCSKICKEQSDSHLLTGKMLQHTITFVNILLELTLAPVLFNFLKLWKFKEWNLCRIFIWNDAWRVQNFPLFPWHFYFSFITLKLFLSFLWLLSWMLQKFISRWYRRLILKNLIFDKSIEEMFIINITPFFSGLHIDFI